MISNCSEAKQIRIAIDGPAGAGKSSVAKEAAKRLGIDYLDTGAMYRAVAYFILKNDIDFNDERALLSALSGVEVDYKAGRTYLNNKDVEGEIRSSQVSKMAATVSALLPVREKLVTMQKQIASKRSILMDGRDIGTNVLKDAELKIFLTASAEERAKRRYNEMLSKGENADFDSIFEDIKKRDYSDENRKLNPLRKAEDAILLDTSEMNINEVIEFIVTVAKDTQRSI